MQRVLRAAYLRTNLNVVEPQIMRRMMLLKYIDTVVEPSLREEERGDDDDEDDDARAPLVAALQRDRRDQAYLQGAMVKAVPGVNTLFDDPDTVEKSAWNTAMRSAFRARATALMNPRLPVGHVMQKCRIRPRNSCFISRTGLCARSVPAYPLQCIQGVDGATGEHAIFSEYEQAAAGAAGVAAQGTVESERYYLTGGSAMTFAVSPPPTRKHFRRLSPSLLPS